MFASAGSLALPVLSVLAALIASVSAAPANQPWNSLKDFTGAGIAAPRSMDRSGRASPFLKIDTIVGAFPRVGRAGPPPPPPPPPPLQSRDGNWTTEDVNGTSIARVNASAATTRTNPLADLAKLPKAELTKLLAAILATSPLDSPLPLLFDPKDFLGLRPLTDFVYPFMDPPYNTLLPALTPKPFREGDAPLTSTRTFDALDVIGKLLGIPGLGKFPLPGLRPLSHFVYPFLPADKYPLLTLLYYLTPPPLRSNEQRDGILDLLKPGVGSLPGAAPVLAWFWPHLDPHFFKPFKPPPRNRVAENQLAENLITRLAELKQRSRK